MRVGGEANESKYEHSKKLQPRQNKLSRLSLYNVLALAYFSVDLESRLVLMAEITLRCFFFFLRGGGHGTPAASERSPRAPRGSVRVVPRSGCHWTARVSVGWPTFCDVAWRSIAGCQDVGVSENQS